MGSAYREWADIYGQSHMSARSVHPPQEAALLPHKLRNVRALWVVLSIMALLACCALLFARGSLRLSEDWQSQLSDTLTVQVLLEDIQDWEPQTSLARETLGEVFPGADIDVLPQAQARELLQPWLGNTSLPDSLAVPGLITLTGPDLNQATAQKALEAAGLRVNIDDNTRYADELGRTARRFVSIGYVTLLLMLIAGLSVNIFATRAGLIAQKDIIRVLVQVGASDKFIARLFIRQALRRGLIGAAMGVCIAFLLWLGLSLLGGWGELGWTTLSAGLVDTLWLVGLGCVFALICAAAAGVTTIRQLAFERRRL